MIAFTNKIITSIFILLLSSSLVAQNPIPEVFSNIHYDKACKLYHQFEGERYYADDYITKLTLSNLQGSPKATKSGIVFNFRDATLDGILYFGLIDYSDSKHPSPVWFKKTAQIYSGKATIKIKKYLSGKYDMSSWEKDGGGTLGYRVVNAKGEILYDGVIAFNYSNEAGFSIAKTIIEGPFVNLVTPHSVTLSFNTNKALVAKIRVENNTYSSPKETTHHEILVDNLKPNTKYSYQIDIGDNTQSYTFKTAPLLGSRKPFVFAYASDSRAGQGGGERNVYGVNYYVMRKIAALAHYKEAAFMQFTGDLVNGYSNTKDDINLQYANWKRAVQPFAHHFPIVATVGNHEAVGKIFKKKNSSRWLASIPGFPFETESPSAVFAENFVNPSSDLISEDGTYYDPNPNTIDFPPYDETVFYYTYDNVAMIVLNSNYFYAPTIKNNPTTGGNLHAYIMDNQLKWLEKTILKLEKDKNIDHIFVTQHTPAFPNGGHVKDDMWYAGNNDPRPTIAGIPVKKGIIERRDEYLDILINKSTKVVAILTGDEHNYNKVEITPKVNIYPENYAYKKVKRNRTLWQINNGSAGAPYYAQDTNTPWTKAVSNFSTQYALVLVYVDGEKVAVRVQNPETFEMIDEFVLRK